jgi:hypothetical protein
VALAATTSGACVQPDAPSVGIKALAADIVFGADPIEEVEVQPTTFEPPVSTEAADEVAALPPQIFEPPAPKSFPRPPFEVPRTKKTVTCPSAAVDEFPDITAPLNVPVGVLPKEGIYRWKKVGLQTTASGETTVIEGFEERAIRNLTVTPPDPIQTSPIPNPPAPAPKVVNPDRMRYTFEVVQPFRDGLAVTKYAVDTAARSAEQNSTAGDLRVTTGEPERGVVIDSVTYTDLGGTATQGTFAPVSGLLLTPLPIRTGEAFQSVAVDPVTQQAWRYDAQLLKRDRVDACGEILEGWRTNGTLTVTGTEGGEREFSVIVSPQFGGIPISESTKGTDADGTQFDITYTIGQLEPSPFPTAT